MHTTAAFLMGDNNPIDDLLLSRLEDHQCVAFSCIEAGGRLVYREDFDVGVAAQVTWQQPDGRLETHLMPLQATLAGLCAGWTIIDVRRPDSDMMYWQAMATLSVPPMPSGGALAVRLGLWTPRARASLIVCAASDLRGCAQVPLSQTVVSEGGMPLAPSLVEALSRSIHPGIRSRFRRAKRRLRESLEREQLRQLVAGLAADAAVEQFQDDWDYTAMRVTAGRPETLVALGGTEPNPARRGHLNAELLKLLESEAFGTGVHSPRAKGSLQPFGASSDLLDDEVAWLGSSCSTDEEDHFALRTLFADLDLTQRQKQIVGLIRDGFAQAEIAQELGISQPAVSQQLAAIRKKATLYAQI